MGGCSQHTAIYMYTAHFQPPPSPTPSALTVCWWVLTHNFYFHPIPAQIQHCFR